MRLLVAALALCGAACAPDVGVHGDGAGGYTLEVRASQVEQTYLVTAPDGRVVAARAAQGASALMEGERARALAADPPPQGEAPPEVLSLRAPGFELNINAEKDGADGESGRVAISLGGRGQTVIVNAEKGGPGEADDRAYVRITGASEDTVRAFIRDAEELSPDVKARMLAELGLGAAQ
jgi:hypothetical protein